MRQNPHQLGRCQLVQQTVHGNVNVVGQFEEHVSSVVRQRQNLAAVDFLHQIWLDPHIRAGQHAQRHLSPVEKLLELLGRHANHLPGVLRIGAQLMGRYHNRADAVGRGDLGHRQRVVPIGRAVIKARCEVAMDVDK